VVLCLHSTLEVTVDPSMLPFGRGRVSLVGEEACQDRLEALLGGQNRAEVDVTLEDDRSTITAVLDGEPVGRLTPKMGLRCEARVIRGKKRIDTFLTLATPWA
jgi:hypothetical protein